MTESTLLKALLSGGDRSREDRLREVAKLLTQVPTPKGGADICVPRECFDGLWNARRALVEAAVAAARALMEFDERLGRFYSSRCADNSQNRDVGAAVRAAASAVVYASDWTAVLMLCKERGIELTELQLIEIVAREVPLAPLPQRQGLQNAWWDTRHRRFPDWEPVGIRPDKFRRHYAVASAASPFLPQ